MAEGGGHDVSRRASPWSGSFDPLFPPLLQQHQQHQLFPFDGHHLGIFAWTPSSPPLLFNTTKPPTARAATPQQKHPARPQPASGVLATRVRTFTHVPRHSTAPPPVASLISTFVRGAESNRQETGHLRVWCLPILLVAVADVAIALNNFLAR